jgi:hypothetical protein
MDELTTAHGGTMSQVDKGRLAPRKKMTGKKKHDSRRQGASVGAAMLKKLVNTK